MKSRLAKTLLTLLAASIAFAFIGYVLFYICFKPVLSPALSAWKILTPETGDPGSDSSEGSDEYVDLYGKDKSGDEQSATESGESSDVIIIVDPDESSAEPKEDTVKSSEVTFPAYGNKFGEVSVDGTSIQGVSLFLGDGKKQLKNGVGMYLGSSFPGLGSTCLISGHNNRDFHALQDAEVGSMIRISTAYGEYVYRITACEVRSSKDSSAYDLAATVENVILYTCYPFDELGLTNKRYFVYGEYVSGPRILLDE